MYEEPCVVPWALLRHGDIAWDCGAGDLTKAIVGVQLLTVERAGRGLWWSATGKRARKWINAADPGAVAPVAIRIATILPTTPLVYSADFSVVDKHVLLETVRRHAPAARELTQRARGAHYPEPLTMRVIAERLLHHRARALLTQGNEQLMVGACISELEEIVRRLYKVEVPR